MASILLRLIIAIIVAFIMGKLISIIKLPSILGWLLTGMLLGPHAFDIIDNRILTINWYQNTVHILECVVGLLIGTELVWKKIKKSGSQIIITTLTQSLGTFLFVTLIFSITFYYTHIPMYLAVILGSIALATAPAPTLSIVREFNTSGPVTNTLIPMAALDDLIGVIVFFSTISIVSGNLSDQKLSGWLIAFVVILPMLIGTITGLLAGIILKKDRSPSITIFFLLITLLMASVVGFIFNTVILKKPVLSFMIIGMSFSATFANMVTRERLEQIMQSFDPFLTLSMIVVILNLGAPLDYHLIFGAGLFTAIYIISRAIGKYFGAYCGATITNSPKSVQKYLGLTLLPHSGVSLVFTGIAVSILTISAPECAKIIQGTIAAAAVINEIIAVIVAKKSFEWAGEFNKRITMPSQNN